MYKVMKSFICRACSNLVISTGHISVDIGDSSNLEVPVVDKFCYLVDMLNVDGEADAAAEARIRIDGINSGSWYHCLPIGIYHGLGEGGCVAVMCEVVCYTEVRLCRAVSATKARIDNRKKTCLTAICPTCPHDMANFGPLTTEIGLGVWDTPDRFNGFHVLAVLLHVTLVLGVSQTLRRRTEGVTYIQQGGHHVGHWLTF